LIEKYERTAREASKKGIAIHNLSFRDFILFSRFTGQALIIEWDENKIILSHS
jgi:hypothetical protein